MDLLAALTGGVRISAASLHHRFTHGVSNDLARSVAGITVGADREDVISASVLIKAKPREEAW